MRFVTHKLSNDGQMKKKKKKHEITMEQPMDLHEHDPWVHSNTWDSLLKSYAQMCIS
jgi:hypothetical protein